MLTHRFGIDDYQRTLDTITDRSCIKSIIVPTS
jgi:hypothetical protein